MFHNIFRATRPRKRKIPQNISKKLLDIGQIRDILGQNVPTSIAAAWRRAINLKKFQTLTKKFANKRLKNSRTFSPLTE